MLPYARPALVAPAVAPVTAAENQGGRTQETHPALHRADWHLCLFVAGGHDRSRRAIENLRRLCASHFPYGARVEVVDIHRALSDALRHQVMVVPSLLRLSPPPIRRVVGDLSDTPAVLRGLDLPGA